MVKLTPDKLNLEPGYEAFPSIFEGMGLYIGDTFKNKNGTEMIVKNRKSSEKWYVVEL